jgi:membrane-associated protein
MAAIVVATAVAGDSVGYEIGRRYGHRVLALPIFDRYHHAIDSGRQRLRTRGGRAVFIGRFTAFLRAIMPGVAGTARMPYRKFLAWNAAGGLVCGLGYTLLGYLAGASYKTLETYAGRFSEGILAAVLLAILVWAIRRRRHDRDPTATPTLTANTSNKPGNQRR